MLGADRGLGGAEPLGDEAGDHPRQDVARARRTAARLGAAIDAVLAEMDGDPEAAERIRKDAAEARLVARVLAQ